MYVHTRYTYQLKGTYTMHELKIICGYNGTIHILSKQDFGLFGAHLPPSNHTLLMNQDKIMLETDP